VLTTIVSIGSYAALLWFFNRFGWFAGTSPGLAGMMAKHAWLKHVPNLSESLQVFAANILSWVLAVAFAFVTNKLFVFESRTWQPGIAARELASFTGSRVFSLMAETFIIVFMVSALGSNEIIAKVVGQVVVLILNYILSKMFVFRKNTR